MTEKEFEYIVQEIRPQLLKLCQRFFSITHLSVESEDAVQETLVKLWKMRDKLDHYQSPLALATIIAKNTCIDYRRKASVSETTLEDANYPSQLSTDQAIIGKDMQVRIYKALSKLPATQRKMLTMRSDGMALNDIATICNANKTSTKTMISAARKTLFKLLNGNNN